MPKKKISKKQADSAKNKSHIYFGLIIITVGIFSLLTVAKFALNSTYILGASTLLTRGGDDSGGESGGGSGSSGESNSGSSGGNSESSNQSSNSGGGNSSGETSEQSHSSDTNESTGSDTPSNVPGTTTVNCTGPDGKIFQTTAASCENLNKQWNHSVSFTVVNTPKHVFVPKPTRVETETENETAEMSSTAKQEDKKIEIKKEHEADGENEQESLEVASKDQQVKINLKKHGTVVELKTNQGKIALHAKQEDGTKTELSDDSFKTVNDELAKENNSEIEQDTSGGFVIKHGSTRAKTTLPVSVNLETHELTVTTEKGTKIVTLLPDDAVNKLVSLKVIDSIEPKKDNTVKLTEVDDTPVFEVEGVDKQKLLGLVPVEIHKTVHMSAEDGTVESTSESFGQKILDLLSF